MAKKNAQHKISLGVNIDHAATLRQVRGATTSYPNLVQLAQICKKSGAQQITIHLREDRRHIQDDDVVQLCRKSPLPINLEVAVDTKMVQVALRNKPAWVCFVPEKRQELTTEGGLDIERCFQQIKQHTRRLQQNLIKVSYFIEPSLQQVELSALAGADAIEFHTGHWVLENGAKKSIVWNNLSEAARWAHQLGLGVHAGHGLDYAHAKKIRKLPHLREVNIGHSLICYSLADGLAKSVHKMISSLKK